MIVLVNRVIIITNLILTRYPTSSTTPTLITDSQALLVTKHPRDVTSLL